MEKVQLAMARKGRTRNASFSDIAAATSTATAAVVVAVAAARVVYKQTAHGRSVAIVCVELN